MGAICCHGEHNFIRSLKNLPKKMLISVMLHIKFDQLCPACLSDIEVSNFDAQGEVPPKRMVRSGHMSNSSEILCLFVTCKSEADPIKTAFSSL